MNAFLLLVYRSISMMYTTACRVFNWDAKCVALNWTQLRKWVSTRCVIWHARSINAWSASISANRRNSCDNICDHMWATQNVHYYESINIIIPWHWFPSIQTRRNKCTICDKGFVDPKSLQTHIHLHGTELNEPKPSEPKRMECYICKHKSISIHKLRDHMRMEHVSSWQHRAEKGI